MAVYSWGPNSHGQLGIGVISEQVISPVDRVKACTPVSIVCGGGHTLLVDKEGQVYACGWNNKYQLGHRSNTDTTEFGRVWDLSGIKFTKLSCGWDSSCGITDDNFLFVWGSNMYGQLGLPREHYPDFVKPFRLHIKAVEISMGLRHTAIVNGKGEVWVTGNGKYGQLGLGPDILHIARFVKVQNVECISHIACGQNHTLAWSTKESILYVWGDNRHGQIILNNTKYPRVFWPQKIDIDVKSQVVKLMSGWTNIALWLNNGKLLTCGRNNYGQLGAMENSTGSFHTVSLPGDRQIKDVAVGSEHSVCLATDGTLWAWGWNEHGNTGTESTQENVLSPTRVKLNATNFEITSVFAGVGGHSFIVGFLNNKTSASDMAVLSNSSSVHSNNGVLSLIHS